MKISCGFIIKSNDKILLCKPFGQYIGNDYWDIPKGMKEGSETELQSAFRETKEETSLDLLLVEGDISDVGRFKYSKQQKYLQIFLFESEIDLTNYYLKCDSLITEGLYVGKPEIISYDWVDIETAIQLSHKTFKKAIRKVANWT